MASKDNEVLPQFNSSSLNEVMIGMGLETLFLKWVKNIFYNAIMKKQFIITEYISQMSSANVMEHVHIGIIL